MLHPEFKSLVKEVMAQGVPWVQGSGGNLSYKEGSQLFIKPSGKRVKDLILTDLAAIVDYPKFKKGFSDLSSRFSASQASIPFELEYSSLIKACQLTPELRPSMETGFHAILPHRYVFHVHSIWMVCLSDLITTGHAQDFCSWYEQNWKNRLGDFKVIPSVQPGFELSHEISKDTIPQIFILSQHGVILQFSVSSYLKAFIEFEKALVKKYFPELPGDVINDIKLAHPRFAKGELKYTSPDIVVMADRFKKYLEPTTDGKMQFKTPEADKDAFENWQSLQMILAVRPQIQELPEKQQQDLLRLPSEMERMKIMNAERKRSP